ncbi:LPXTG cell wall anchor domain-containing protein [Alkalihalobacterium bogoriense]|uniref:LPXTG cell wall anchor domain-containing protein n=1 Tax=Alkalihalobacterium bogoriense TaxID=246272 RepID=UPI00047BC6BA|nr:LPXTG cell wall anchor domain-containing protein [Alkalihalobacterium bogoriense]
MKIISVLLILFGVILTFLGVLPYIFNNPHSAGPYSGPANYWELLLMIAYDSKPWYIIIGVCLLISMISSLLLKRRKLNF